MACISYQLQFLEKFQNLFELIGIKNGQVMDYKIKHF